MRRCPQSLLVLLISFISAGVVFLLPFAASARVFEMQNEVFNSYFKINGGTHAVGKTAFAGTVGTDISYEVTESIYQYGGELGWTYTAERLGVRLALDYLKLVPITADGNHSSGTKYYGVVSEVSALTPKAALDLHLKRWKTSRLLLGFEVGQSVITVTNTFSMTSAGSAALGTADFIERASATGLYYGVLLGYEGHLSDTTTYLVDFGYRNLNSEGLSTSSAYTGFDGAVANGAALTNETGSERTLSIEGLHLGIAFRIYL